MVPPLGIPTIQILKMKCLIRISSFFKNFAKKDCPQMKKSDFVDEKILINNKNRQTIQMLCDTIMLIDLIQK